MGTILAIDPGTTESGWVLLDSGVPIMFGKDENEDVISMVYEADCFGLHDPSIDGNVNVDTLAIEMVASYGMAVGAEVFETCVWIGRFTEAWSPTPTRVYRKDVKMHLCGQTRAKDGNVRQALIDRFGGKDKAIGKKASPGVCYGMAGDVWQALALAVTVHDGAAG